MLFVCSWIYIIWFKNYWYKSEILLLFIMIKINIFLITVAICSQVKGFQKAVDSLVFRNLTAWASYSSWSSWNSDNSCSYLDGLWTADPGSSIALNTYVQATEYQYWNNAVSSGYIQFDSSSLMTIDLSAKSTASAISHPLCEWKIVPYSNLDVKIEISRNSANYEDIYIYYNTSSGSSYYSNKNLANWGSSSNTVKLYWNYFINFNPTV